MRLLDTPPVARAAALVLITALAACGGDAASATPGAGGPGGGGGPQITPVEIATVKRVNIARTSLVTGQLAPLRVVGVTSQIAGALLRVPVEEGSRVRRGDLLAELDSRELDAQLRAARANLTFARATSQRSTQMRDNQVITAAEFERDQAALVAAEATVSQLETRMSFTRIEAPIEGVVMQRFVQAGDVVGGATRMFTIADVGTLVTQLPVSELEVPFLSPGAAVRVDVDALGRSVAGRIRRIFPAADSVSRLVPVEVAITGRELEGLRPGYSVRVTLSLDERAGALVVPTRAVVGAAGSQSVYIIRDGRAERRRVRVGTDIEGQVEVLDGVAFGDTVITTGNALLRDGATVRIVEPLRPESTTSPRPVPVPGARP